MSESPMIYAAMAAVMESVQAVAKNDRNDHQNRGVSTAIRTPVRYNDVAGRRANVPGRGHPRESGGNVTDDTCAIDDCPRARSSRGWCRRHYEAWRRHGDPLGMSRTVGDTVGNFWRKVDAGHPLGCWTWTAAIGTHGYGVFNSGPSVLAHRYAYELLVGPIPEGLDLDHLCRNPPCVNPHHLEPVTRGENVRRGVAGERMARMNRGGWGT